MEDALPVSAIILAGGKSTRLGRDKASEPLLGVVLLQRVVSRIEGVAAEVVIVKARGQTLPAISSLRSLKVVEDLYPETGPLGGIYTGLVACSHQYAIALATDMPLVQAGLIAELVRQADGHDVVIPVSEEYPQPLCSVYSKACIGPMRKLLESGQYKISAVFGLVRPRYLQPEDWRPFDPEGRSFMNLNRDDDLRRAETLLQAESSTTTSDPY